METGTKVQTIIKSFGGAQDNEKRLVEALQGTIFYEPMQIAYGNFLNDGHYHHFEVQLHKRFLWLIAKDEILHYQGPYPVFAYLLKREYEMKNLMMLTKAIAERYSPEEKMGMMII